MPHGNPDEWTKLKAKLSLVDTLVREFVCYQTPVIHTRRTASRDVVLVVYKIRVGDKIFMWYFGANRDEPVIRDPDRFCINREIPCKHRSFGAKLIGVWLIACSICYSAFCWRIS